MKKGEKVVEVWGEGAHRGVFFEGLVESEWFDFILKFTEAARAADQVALEQHRFEQRDKTEV